MEISWNESYKSMMKEIRKAPSLIQSKQIVYFYLFVFLLVRLSLWKSFNQNKNKYVFRISSKVQEISPKASQILCQKLVIWRGFCPQKFDGSLAKESRPGGKASCSNDAIQVRLSLLLSF